MAFDEQLADAVRTHAATHRGLVEKRMFGGVAFLINGNMSVGIHKNDLIVRLAPEAAPDALKQPGARVFDITGRPMKGWVLVAGANLKEPKTLKAWVEKGISYASSLPKKKK